MKACSRWKEGLTLPRLLLLRSTAVKVERQYTLLAENLLKGLLGRQVPCFVFCPEGGYA